MSPWRQTWADFRYEWRQGQGLTRVAALAGILAAAVRLIGHLGLPGGHPLRMIGRDLDFAWRRLRQAPLFAIFAVCTLALGIGAATAVYSVIHAVALKQPAIDDVDRVVKLYHSDGGNNSSMGFSWPDVGDLKARQTTFDHMAAWTRLVHVITLNGGARAFNGEFVDGDYFAVLRARPVLGRLIQRHDDDPASPPVAVLGFDFWRSAFNADPAVVNTKVDIGGHAFTIVGVAAQDVRGVDMPTLTAPALWVPIRQRHLLARPGFPAFQGEHDRERRWASMVGRLRDDVSLAQAAAEVRQIGEALDVAAPIGQGLDARSRAIHTVSRPWMVRRVSDVRIHESMSSIVGPVIGTVVVAVVLVLMVACTNLANLLLARGAGRRQEFAVRMALGASRWRLLREQFVECGLLAIAGGVAALLVARALMLLLSTDFQVGDGISVVISVRPELNAPVFALAVGATVLALLTFGVVPAWHSTGGDVRSVLNTDAGGGAFPRWRGRRLLIQLQVAVSVALLAIMAVTAGRAVHMGMHDPGFALDRLALVTTDPSAFPQDQARAVASMAAARDRVAQFPGVDAVTYGTALPIGVGASNIQVRVPASGRGLRTVYGSAGYLHTVGVPLLEGRDFDETDTAPSRRTVILSARAAEQLFDRRQVVGQQITFRPQAFLGEQAPADVEATIVGVVADISDPARDNTREGMAYLPVEQHSVRRLVLVARTDDDTSALSATMRVAVAEANTALPITGVSTGLSVSEASTQVLRIAAGTTGLLGGFAAALAVIGLYGVLSFLVARRSREIGLRIALGADRARVLRLILGDGLKPVIWGVALGAGLAVPVLLSPLSRVMFRSTDHQLGLALLAPVVMVIAAAVAAWWPARRAARVDPNEALRQL